MKRHRENSRKRLEIRDEFYLGHRLTAAVIFRWGCLTKETGVFGEVSRQFLFGFFPVHVGRRSPVHFIYISSLCEQGSGSEGGSCSIPSRSFLRGSIVH